MDIPEEETNEEETNEEDTYTSLSEMDIFIKPTRTFTKKLKLVKVNYQPIIDIDLND